MSGIIRVGVKDTQFDAARQLHLRAMDLAVNTGGNAIIRRCETSWKSQLPVWGQPPKSLALMRQVKQQFDPRNLFNPGRYG